LKNVLVELDKTGAEWVVVAHLTGDANMLAVIEEGKSPHTVTGSLISGLSEDVVDKENKVIGQNTNPELIAEMRDSIPELRVPDVFLPRSMSIRQAGKKSNHGLNYDMRYKRFALENEMDETEAKRIVELYRTVAYPGIPIWHKTVQHTLRETRTLTNCFGRKRRFMEAWGPELFDSAYSFLPQSTVFDCTREGMVKTYNDKSSVMQKVEILGQIHDSTLNQMPADPALIAEAGVKIGLDYMNPLLVYNSKEFRIGTTMKIGTDWGHMHEAVLSDNQKETEKSVREVLRIIKNDREAA
jgi:DNA polymerase I-like protein with 3'-5' exonuclease and polymerase domains|tara:strand:+ start:14889 stop:15782 length:894 start_codon:yes stop_codon:yes gene_type:complete